MSQKGSKLVGDGIDEEVLASTDSIFAPGSYGSGQKGLQQWFTPEKAASLAHEVLGHRSAILDLTAGDGSLLKYFDPPHSYGIEIDKDQIDAAEGSYNAIKGDIQHVYPLIRLTMPSWNAIAINPPFGLTWQEPTIRDGRPTNSSVMAWIMANRLLSEDGQLVAIFGRDRFYRQIADLPESSGVYAVVECDDLGKETGFELPCVMVFAVHPGNRSGGDTGFEKRECPLEMLDLLGSWVAERRKKALGDYGRVRMNTHVWQHAENFQAIQKEYDRRVEKRLGTSKREFDAQLLDGKTVQWLPSAFVTLSLRQHGDAAAFSGLNGQPVNYFIQDERLWVKLMSYAESGILTLDPKLIQAIEDVLTEIRKVICPLYKIRPTQRLGYLTDLEALRCIKDDPDKGFVKGESYRLHTESQTIQTQEERVVESKKTPGEYETKTFLQQRKVLSIKVGHWAFTDGDDQTSDNIKYLLGHFHMPDPGEVGNRHPDEIRKLEDLAQTVLDEFQANSRKWEAENKWTVPYSHRAFQKRDIARLLFKGSGLLSWEQGLGKTIGALLFTECNVRLGAQDARLYIVPKDLLNQWQREIKRFTGKEATLLKPRPTTTWMYDEKTGQKEQKTVQGIHGQLKEVASRLKRGGTGTYLTYYEALARVGTNRSRAMPTITVKEFPEQKLRKGTDRYGYFYRDFSGWTEEQIEANYDPYSGYMNGPERDENDQLVRTFIAQIPCQGHHDPDLPTGAKVAHGYIRPIYDTVTKKITSKEICPECHADRQNGWNGLYCDADKTDGSKCGYAHYDVRIKPAASILSTAFRRGCIVIDEITMIQGNTAQRSKALRGLQSKHKLGMTGTPVKNFIHQAFWLLWWCLGDGSKRFGFTYKGGYLKFMSRFSVMEGIVNGNRVEGMKPLPEVTNLSLLWRMLASSIIRRRKEETGEKLVPKFIHHIEVPLGIGQTKQMQKWLKDFPKYFIEKHPESKLAKCGKDVVRIWAPMIGLNWKLDYTCTIPKADSDWEWTGVEDVSDYTPANMRVIEMAMALAKEGRKVLIGSNLVKTSKWITDRLNEKGVKAVHILDENGVTANPDKRAQRVYSFQTDEVQVFAAGVNAIRLGHNLDAADAVIMHGLDWSYDTFDQFIARVHRLTSQNPIDIYVVLPKLDGQHTITTRKWGILEMKGQAAELALDGRLIEKIEDAVDKSQVIRELMERGITVSDDAVDEVDVQEAWDTLPQVEDYVIPEGLIPPQPELPEEYEWTPEDAYEAFKMYEQLFPAQLLGLPAPGETTEGIGGIAVEDVVPDELVEEVNAAEFVAFAGDAETVAEIHEEVAIVTNSSASGSDESGALAAPEADVRVASAEPPSVEPEESGASPLAPAADADPMAAMLALMQQQQAAITALAEEVKALKESKSE